MRLIPCYKYYTLVWLSNSFQELQPVPITTLSHPSYSALLSNSKYLQTFASYRYLNITDSNFESTLMTTECTMCCDYTKGQSNVIISTQGGLMRTWVSQQDNNHLCGTHTNTHTHTQGGRPPPRGVAVRPRF